MTGYVGMLGCWDFRLLDPVGDFGRIGRGDSGRREKEKERDRYTPWLHREVQGRVAGPVVQLRFISLFPGRVRVSSSELAHYGAADLA